jgi:hypothetical protein
MFTLGFGWKPVGRQDAIADGADILNYLRETAASTALTAAFATTTR